MSSKELKICVIPDTQCRPGVRLDHLEWAGKYIAEKEPDVIVHLGDHWDMHSLSSYDKGKRVAEGRRVQGDVDAGNKGLSLLDAPIAAKKNYNPKKKILRGNHEERFERYTNDHPELEGAVGYHQFNDVELGWDPIPFLQPITIGGVAFCHYFPRGSDGNVGQTKRGAPSAKAQLTREMQSCVAGHRQGLDLAVHTNGKRILRSIIAGSFYQHTEGYLSPQGNHHWQGILMLHEVKDGNFNLMEISMKYLKNRYGKKK